MTLFMAGHETTAVTLAWTWYLLAQHPEVETRLAAELRDVLGGRTPTVADLPALKYAEMVVTESMRLYPPAYGLGRQGVRPTEIAGPPPPEGGEGPLPGALVGGARLCLWVGGGGGVRRGGRGRQAPPPAPALR